MTFQHTPVTLAVTVSVVAAALVLAAGLAIAGSYYLSLGAINRAAAIQAQLVVRAEAAQVLRAVPTCKAIVRMDEASHISDGGFPAPPHNLYDKRLSAAIHDINSSSHCPLILRDVANHVPAIKILAQLSKGQ